MFFSVQFGIRAQPLRVERLIAARGKRSMANSAGMFIAEGSIMKKPPAFSGDDYPYWADRMQMYIKSTQYRLWKIITEGDLPIIKPRSKMGK